MKKATALALIIALCLTLLPASALAASKPYYLTISNDDTMGSFYFQGSGDETQYVQNAGMLSGYDVAVYVTPKDGYALKSARVTETVKLGPTGSAARVVESTLVENIVIFKMPEFACTVYLTYEKLVTAPVITAHPRDVTVEAGGDAYFSVTATGDELTYKWYRLDPGLRGTVTELIDSAPSKTGGISGSHTANLSLTGVSAKLGGVSFRCVVENSAGSVTSGSALLTVKEAAAAPVITVQPKSLSVSEGEALAFSVAATGTDLHYRWTVAVNGQNETFFSADMDAPTLAYTYSADYAKHNGMEVWCEVYNTVESVTSDTATVTVKKPLITGNPFTDIFPSDWYYGDVLNAVGLGIVDGTTDTTYSPGANLTFAAAVKLACCIHQRHLTGAITLTNSPTGSWFDSYTAYALANSIPVPDAALMNTPITRREFVRTFYYALPASEYSVINAVSDGAVPDVPGDGSELARIVYAFYRAGILTGSDEQGSFKPDTNIRRSEVAAIISRMVDKTARKSIVLPAPDVSALTLPSCWTAADERVVFFTTRDGLPAVRFGTWDFTGGRDSAFITRVERSGDTVRISYYNPPLREPADSQDTQPWYGQIVMDISDLEQDGTARIAIDGAAAYQYKQNGVTWEEGYISVH